VKGWHGYVVAPPSRHPEGGTYAWEPDHAPDDIELAPAPDRLLALLKPKPPQPAPVAPRAHDSEIVRRARAYLATIPGAISGSRGHDQTWRAALHMVRGFGLDEQTAYDLLATEYNPRCEPLWSEKELRHKIEGAARDATVTWGYLGEARPPSRPTREPGSDDDDPPPYRQRVDVKVEVRGADEFNDDIGATEREDSFGCRVRGNH